MDAALEDWKSAREAHVRQIATYGHSALPPFDWYIIHMAKLVQVCSLKNLDAKSLKTLLNEVEELTAIAIEHTKEKQAAKNSDEEPP